MGALGRIWLAAVMGVLGERKDVEAVLAAAKALPTRRKSPGPDPKAHALEDWIAYGLVESYRDHYCRMKKLRPSSRIDTKLAEFVFHEETRNGPLVFRAPIINGSIGLESGTGR